MNTKKTLADVRPGGRVRLGTPGARWAATGEPDPHGTRYDCERSELAMGNLSDDELANAVFINGDRNLTFAQMTSGELPGSAYLAAAKDRIRWLSRALAAAEALSAQPSPGGQGVWPFVESPYDFTERLREAMEGSFKYSLLGAVRHVLIEKPPALSAQPHPPSSFDLEAMLAACVPGGDIADPQVIADNIRHWFAAQPSPGGLGDALDCIGRIEEAIEFRVPHDIYAAVHGELAELKAALSARQPVRIYGCCAQPEGELHTAECPTMRHLAARQPSKQPDSVALGEATEFCIEKGNRQPVGEPVGYFDPDVLAHLTEGLIDPVGVLRRKPKGKSNVPVWLGPPAQVVDLGQKKDAARYQLLRSKLATSDLHIILSREGSEVEAADYVDSEIDKVMRNG